MGNMTCKLTIVNDNHFVTINGSESFVGSKFHLFIKGFRSTKVELSSPTNGFVSDKHNIIIDGVKILPRHGYGTASKFYKRILRDFLKHYKAIHQHIYKCDVALLVAPACTLPLSYCICRFLKKPFVLYVVGDVVEVVKQDEKGKIFLRIVKNAVSRWEWAVIRYITKRHTTFTLGGSLYNKLLPVARDLHLAMTSLVTNDSILTPAKKNLSNPIKLLTVSRLSQEKGINIAIRAIATILNDYDVVYVIVGDGPEMERLKLLVHSLDIGCKVLFMGYQDQTSIQQLYADADVFILPSFSEGIPKVILDAMATATPVISTKVGGIPDMLSYDDSRGWLVPPHDKQKLAGAILNCIRDSEARYSKVVNAHNYIKRHTMEKEADRIETILFKLFKKSNMI